jgi:hypothetical protein
MSTFLCASISRCHVATREILRHLQRAKLMHFRLKKDYFKKYYLEISRARARAKTEEWKMRSNKAQSLIELNSQRSMANWIEPKKNGELARLHPSSMVFRCMILNSSHLDFRPRYRVD